MSVINLLNEKQHVKFALGAIFGRLFYMQRKSMFAADQKGNRHSLHPFPQDLILPGMENAEIMSVQVKGRPRFLENL